MTATVATPTLLTVLQTVLATGGFDTPEASEAAQQLVTHANLGGQLPKPVVLSTLRIYCALASGALLSLTADAIILHLANNVDFGPERSGWVKWHVGGFAAEVDSTLRHVVALLRGVDRWCARLYSEPQVASVNLTGHSLGDMYERL